MNMKYKILITGKNEAAIDDFFMRMSDSFEVVTTSTRYADISSHISFFRPDAFVYCLHNESRDDITQIVNLKFRLSSSKIPLVIFGVKEDCDEFVEFGPNAADLILQRPMMVSVIQSKIIDYVKELRFASAVDAVGEEQAADRNAARESTVRDSASNEEASVAQALFTGSSVPRTAQEVVSGQRKHILVVDDNTMMLKMMKEHLHDQYDVATAASGRVALKFLERKHTDLILLDYEMPEESGPVVLEKLRASEKTKNIPVIFLTGVTESRKIKEALALKPQNYLLKPVDREKLLDTIAKTIG